MSAEAMERLLKRAAEQLHCGLRGIPLGRNSWDLLQEIEFLLGARDEDRRAAAAQPPREEWGPLDAYDHLTGEDEP